MSSRKQFLQTLGLVTKAQKLVSGDALLPAIRNQKVYLVVLADDASARSQKEIRDKCQFYKIKVIDGFSKDEISRACGLVNRIAIGITDQGLSKVLEAYIEERGA